MKVISALLTTGFLQSKQLTKLEDKNSLKKSLNQDRNVFNMFMIGDWGGPHAGNGGPDQDEYGFSIGNGMNELAGEMELDSILLLGDNIYNEGVNDVFDKRWETTYQSTFNGSNLRTTKMYATFTSYLVSFIT